MRLGNVHSVSDDIWTGVSFTRNHKNRTKIQTFSRSKFRVNGRKILKGPVWTKCPVKYSPDRKFVRCRVGTKHGQNLCTRCQMRENICFTCRAQENISTVCQARENISNVCRACAKRKHTPSAKRSKAFAFNIKRETIYAQSAERGKICALPADYGKLYALSAERGKIYPPCFKRKNMLQVAPSANRRKSFEPSAKIAKAQENICARYNVWESIHAVM